MPRLRRMLTGVVITLIAGYLALCAALFFLQRRLLFPAPPARAWPASAPGKLARVSGRDGSQVDTWFLPGPPGAPVLAYFHGNGEQLADGVPLGEWAHAHGFGFYAVEYPGYGGAPGAPSEATILPAARTAMAHLRGLGVPAAQTVLFGRSLGTGVAAALAADGAGAKLVLLSPYTSIPDVGALAFPYFPVHLLARDPFNTLALAPRLTLPTLLVHGTADEVIPFAIGERLAHALPEARFIAVPGAGHNDLPDRSDVLAAVAAFAADVPQTAAAHHG